MRSIVVLDLLDIEQWKNICDIQRPHDRPDACRRCGLRDRRQAANIGHDISQLLIAEAIKPLRWHKAKRNSARSDAMPNGSLPIVAGEVHGDTAHGDVRSDDRAETGHIDLHVPAEVIAMAFNALRYGRSNVSAA